jgi:hypothetical protein
VVRYSWYEFIPGVPHRDSSLRYHTLKTDWVSQGCLSVCVLCGGKIQYYEFTHRNRLRGLACEFVFLYSIRA